MSVQEIGLFFICLFVFLMPGKALQWSLHLGGNGRHGAAYSETHQVGHVTPPAHTEGSVTRLTLGILSEWPFHSALGKNLVRPRVCGSVCHLLATTPQKTRGSYLGKTKLDNPCPCCAVSSVCCVVCFKTGSSAGWNTGLLPKFPTCHTVVPIFRD